MTTKTNAPGGSPWGEALTGATQATTPLAVDPGYFNVVLQGTFTATVVVQISFDGGVTWVALARDMGGISLSLTAPGCWVAYQPESGVLIRGYCSAYTSGTVNVRVSQ